MLAGGHPVLLCVGVDLEDMSSSAEDGLFPHFAQWKLALKFLLLCYGITSKGISPSAVSQLLFHPPRSFSGGISVMLTIQLVPLGETISPS